MTHTVRATALVGTVLLGFAGASFAQEPEHVPAAEPAPVEQAPEGHEATEGHEAAGEEHAATEAHAAEAAHAEGGTHAEGGEHAEGAAHGLAFTGDANGNGVPDWRDSASEHNTLVSLGFHLFNLLVYGGIALLFIRPAIRDGLRARAAGIKANIVEAAKLRDEATANHDAVTKRLEALSKEIADMSARAEVDAQNEQARILERAKDATKRVAETAQRQIADEGARARRAVRDEAVLLAVQLAEGILASQVQTGDQKRLADEFLTTLKSEGRHV